jgi:hypothetical protein
MPISKIQPPQYVSGLRAMSGVWPEKPCLLNCFSGSTENEQAKRAALLLTPENDGETRLFRNA